MISDEPCVFTVVSSHFFHDREGEEDEQLNAMMKNFSRSIYVPPHHRRLNSVVTATKLACKRRQLSAQTHTTLTVVVVRPPVVCVL